MSTAITPTVPSLPVKPGETITEVDRFTPDARGWPAVVALVSYEGRHLDIAPSALKALRRGIDEALAECERLTR